MGYKPFYKEYTTDWDCAVAKMKEHFWQRRLVHTSYKHERPWMELKNGSKTNNGYALESNGKSHSTKSD